VWRTGQMKLLFQGLVFQVALEDRFDALIGAGAKVQRPFAGGFQALQTRTLAEIDDAQAGAITHFWMRLATEDGFDHLGTVGAGFGGPADQAAGGPLQVSLMGLGPVFFQRGGTSGLMAERVRTLICFERGALAHGLRAVGVFSLIEYRREFQGCSSGNFDRASSGMFLAAFE
jgi:hypothetical protein